MERSITQRAALDRQRDLDAAGSDASETDAAGTDAADREAAAGRDRTWWRAAILVGLAIAFVCFVAYVVSRPERHNFYVHFLWQADAWLHGQTSIAYPVAGVPGGTPGNDWYQDVMPVLNADGLYTGRAIIPFPPLPAVALLPFVAIFGLQTDEQLLAMFVAAVDVAIAYWMLGGLPIRGGVRVLGTVFLGLGTVLWYAAATGTTWFWAHIVALAFLFLAVGVALRADRAATVLEPLSEAAAAVAAPLVPARVRESFRIDPVQLLAGLLFGLAVTARLTIVFGFPFFMLVGPGRNWVNRTLSAGIGAAVPIAALLLYTLVSTGHVFNPAYDYLYRLEATGYPFLHYNPAWSVEDIRYVPQNIAIMLANLPQILPSADTYGRQLCVAEQARSLFDPACPIAMPDPVGMSLILTSPAYLFAVAALRPLGRLRLDRATAGALIAVGAIALANLMHFSQGWVQFGYRFSNDFVPFALLLVVLGAARLRSLWLFGALVALSVIINAWGVYWGGTLGW